MSDKLHLLLHSLSRSEKRYCRLQSRGGDNASMNEALFDLMAEMEEYDEEALLAGLRERSLSLNLSSAKNYLYEWVLRCMRTYREEDTGARRILSLIADCEFLYDKQLFELCRSRLEQAAKLAHRLEAFTSQLEIIRWKRRLLKHLNPGDYAAQLEVLIQEGAHALNCLTQEQELQNLYEGVFETARRFGQFRGDDKTAPSGRKQEHPLLSEGAALLSFRARAFHFQARAILAQLNGEVHSAFSHYTRLVQEWQSHSWMKEEAPERWLAVLANYLHACSISGHYHQLPQGIEMLRSQQFHTELEEARRRQSLCFYQLVYLLNAGDLSEAVHLEPEVVAILSGEAAVPQAFLLGFRLNLALAFLFSGEHKRSLHWVNEIINQKRSHTRLDIQRLAALLRVVIHFELGNEDLLDAQIRSAERLLGKEGFASAFHKRFLSLLREIIREGDDKVRRARFTSAEAELRAMQEPHSESGERSGAELIMWLRSKATGLSLASIAREKTTARP